MKKKFSEHSWICSVLGIVACSMMLFASSANAASDSEPKVQQPQQLRGSISVSGVVKDAQGEPIIGASVRLVGYKAATLTDVNGKFGLQVLPGGTLEISYIGYVTKRVQVGPHNRNVSIVLDEDSKMLNEVVAIGYGTATKKKDLSAAVGVVNNVDALTAHPVTSAEAMLQGQMAGVTVASNGGDPTAAPNIVIRGQGSQNGDNVLWVVDGVPGAPVSSLNDIESIVVLKDAASAAIYGAQSGAGGVVLVTTKKAKKGATSISYDGMVGFRNAMNLPTPLNAEQQIEMRKRSYAAAGQPLLDGWDVEKNPWIATTRTNWMDEVFRTAFYQRHNVSLNTGTDSFLNRLSFSFDNDEGILRYTFNKNIALHYNGRYELNKWLAITEDFVWKNTSNRTSPTNEGYYGPILSAIYMPASATVYSPFTKSGFGGTTTEDPAYIAKYGSNFAEIHGDAVNPINTLSSQNIFNRTNDAWSTTSLEIKNVVPGLKFVSRFTYNLQSNYNKTFTPRRDEIGKPMTANSLVESTYRTDQWKTENTLTYDNTFGKHTVGALLSTTADRFTVRGFEVTGKTFANEYDYLQYLLYAGSVAANDYMTGPDANVSLIARAAYSYADRYFFTASWRRDYAGRLPKDNNHGDFPAVTAGWKISNESFFPKNTAVSLLKLRASWGRVGNLGSIGYNYRSPLLTAKVWQLQSQYGVEKNSMWNTIVYNQKVLNNKLTWETSEQFDLGLDFNLLNDRLAMQFDWFEKRTFNLIQSQSMNWPGSMGLDAMLVNQGEVRNRGFEASVNWNDRINKNWAYYVNANFAWLKNWVSDIGVKDANGKPGVWTGDGSFRNGNFPYCYQDAEGQPLGSFYLIKSAGIFQSDAEADAYRDKNGNRIQPNAKAGDLKFIDYNKDGKIDDKDRQYLGSATPKYTFSLSAGFTWRDLSFSAMFQGVAGAKAMNVAKFMTLSDVEGNFNRDSRILDAWSETNRNSDIPRLSKNDPNNNFGTPSDWYLENASYLRLKNLTVGYDLTNLIRKCAHLNIRNSRLSVYLSGENLFTITNYTGIDPECGGWDAMKYPVARTFTFGVKLTY